MIAHLTGKIISKKPTQIILDVNGVGPKSAQSILSGIQIEELHSALRNNDLSRIIAIPGIGRKTGERLLIELRDKVEKLSDTFEAVADSSYSIKKDAILALTQLGYNQKTAEKVVRNISDKIKDSTLEVLLKNSLAELNK